MFGLCKSRPADRPPAPERPPARALGVAFPVDPKTGKVSTTATAKAIWCAAAGPESASAAAIQAERDWRHNYPAHLVRLEAAGFESCAASVRAAVAGLAAVRSEFELVRRLEDGLDEAAAETTTERIESVVTPAASTLRSVSVQGKAAAATLAEVLSPFKEEGPPPAGSAEPSVAASLQALLHNDAAAPEELAAVLREKVFVLLGGTSELGPYLSLVKLGATVVVVSRRGAKLAALIQAAGETAAGQVVFPTAAGPDQTDQQGLAEAGADVILSAPALTAWIAGLFPKRTLVLGCYIYLDGEAHVRASVAMDLIVDGVVSRRRPGSTSVAFLGSPATAHLIGQQAYDDATARYADRPWHHAPFGYEQNNRAGGPRSDGLVASTRQSGTTVSRTMTDGFSVFQGPNYALAKTIQMWRVAVLLEKGVAVSVNMAPASRTESVVHSPQAKAAIEGLAWFAPYSTFDPPYVSALMAGLLLHDMVHPEESTLGALGHPGELVVKNSFHGGSARCGYKSDSIGKTAFIIGKVGLT